MDWDRFIINRLFIAVPELFTDKTLVEALVAAGLFSKEDAAMAERLIKAGAITLPRMRGKNLLQRIALVAPELLSSTTIDVLRRFDLIDVKTGHALRVTLRAAKRILPGSVTDESIARRLLAASGELLSRETVAFIRNLDNERIKNYAALLRAGRARLTEEEADEIKRLLAISVARARIAKEVISGGKELADAFKSARTADNVWDALLLASSNLIDSQFLERMGRLGIISHARLLTYRALAELGLDIWRKTNAAAMQNSMQARILMMGEGIISHEMLNALYASGLISKDVERLLRPGVTIIRNLMRDQLAMNKTMRRVRQKPGEPLIKAFARSSGATDRALLRLLGEAAADARREALKFDPKKVGGKAAAAQRNIVARSLHLQMHALWEGNGALTIFGEREVGRAAIQAMDDLFGVYGSERREQLARMIRYQAQAGLDNYISRHENIRVLSARVYKNWQLAMKMIDREIDKALLRNLSAREFAANIQHLIKPGTPGGVSYAAMRLARTEINNAFHATSIRSTVDMPWVSGYKWNLSGSHPRTDICNDMAETDHAGKGKGVYKKRDVPGKPHPHCFCYVTTELMDDSDFERGLRRGNFDSYLKSLEKRHPGFSQEEYTEIPRVRSALVDAAFNALT